MYSCSRRVNVGYKNTPSIQHPRRRDVTTSMVGLRNVLIRKKKKRKKSPKMAKTIEKKKTTGNAEEEEDEEEEDYVYKLNQTTATMNNLLFCDKWFQLI